MLSPIARKKGPLFGTWWVSAFRAERIEEFTERMLNCHWEAAQDKHLDASTCGCLGLGTRLPVSPLLGPVPEGWLHLWVWRRRRFEVIHLQLQRRAARIPLATALQDWHQRSSPLSTIRMPGISIISCGEGLNKPSVRLSFQQHLFQTSLDGKGTTSGKGTDPGQIS